MENTIHLFSEKTFQRRKKTSKDDCDEPYIYSCSNIIQSRKEQRTALFRIDYIDVYARIFYLYIYNICVCVFAWQCKGIAMTHVHHDVSV